MTGRLRERAFAAALLVVGFGTGGIASVARADAPVTPTAVMNARTADATRLSVPYRSQLDGSPWAAANCGPTVLSMAMEALGERISPTRLRQEVLAAQDLEGNDVGSFVEALAQVAVDRGHRPLGMVYENETLRRWSLQDVRAHLDAGRPVILQVAFARLPGREQAPYQGDHFIVMTGWTGQDFLYHDPIDRSGGGPDVTIDGARLLRAMRTEDARYAFTGLALGGG